MTAFALASFFFAFVVFVYPTTIFVLTKPLGIEQRISAGNLKDVPARFSRRMIEGSDESFRARVENPSNAVKIWREHPFVGTGPSGFLWPQLRNKTTGPIIIHSTYLWWIAEFGLIGTVIFLRFFIVCTLTLARDLIGKSRKNRSDTDLMSLAALGVIAVLAGASVGMEAMYQRHIWFLLGWALALPTVAAGSATQSASNS